MTIETVTAAADAVISFSGLLVFRILFRSLLLIAPIKR